MQDARGTSDFEALSNRFRISMTAADFLAQAWKLADNRARQLGWIV